MLCEDVFKMFVFVLCGLLGVGKMMFVCVFV